MNMKIRWKPFLISLGIPLAIGGLSAFLTNDSMKEFQQLNQPPLSPPGWLFPVVWSILFVLMGIASYLVCTSDVPRRDRRTALWLYGVQLGVNFFWSIFFFNLGLYLFSFLWLLFLWVLLLALWLLFRRISKPAGWLLVPYLLWVTFAGYLNLGIYFLN